MRHQFENIQIIQILGKGPRYSYSSALFNLWFFKIFFFCRLHSTVYSAWNTLCDCACVSTHLSKSVDKWVCRTCVSENRLKCHSRQLTSKICAKRHFCLYASGWTVSWQQRKWKIRNERDELWMAKQEGAAKAIFQNCWRIYTRLMDMECEMETARNEINRFQPAQTPAQHAIGCGCG